MVTVAVVTVVVHVQALVGPAVVVVAATTAEVAVALPEVVVVLVVVAEAVMHPEALLQPERVLHLAMQLIQPAVMPVMQALAMHGVQALQKVWMEELSSVGNKLVMIV